MVESHRARLDELLRRVQQVRDVLSPATDQHLLDAVGAQEIQATAHLETVQGLVAWAHREEPELFAHWAWMRAYHWTG